MGVAGGPDIERNGLVFGYDSSYGINTNRISSRFYPGGSTENLISQMVGTTDFSYPEVVYRCTATETNISDSTAPGGKYSKFTGIDSSSNNQLYSRFNTAGIDVRNSTITYSVYLKGSGTCHLTIYADNAGYGTSSTITLTDKWTRYTYSKAVTNYTSNCWVAVRGVLDSTDVYIAAQQAEIKSFSTPFTTGTRSSTQSLIDLTKTTNIDVSNVSFDSTGQPTFDGTDDRISIPAGSFPTIGVNDFTVEVICKNTKTSSYNHFFSVKDQSHFALKMENAGSRRAYVYRTSGTSTYSAVPTYLTSTSNYYHLLVKREGDNLEIFLNGVSTGTKSGWDNLSIDNNAHTSYIGWGWGSEYTGGNIPLVKVYDRALSADEVQQNYNAYKNRFNL